MKSVLILILAFLLATAPGARAQMSDASDRDVLEFLSDEPTGNPQAPVLYKYQANHILLTNLKTYNYDRISVTDMKGNVVLKQETTANNTRLDISSLADGVFVLTLRSSCTMKEKQVKFLIRR